uniref:Pre-mRNA-splicing factor ISY1 n=1 Tax=Entomoneis paludosa TaxID=265537 RepID=A0A7S2YFP1_9STRA|mmetsp:Transcript_30754/g.64213  ORF Transcript_30754/g.64213 Transcript_30754/m.64213 type:complete len:236 (+) Transcript_30754:69-776(+)
MARPAEKARSMLNKWVALREKGNTPAFNNRNKRPHLASECQHLADAERFRGQIIREITNGIAKIQNPALPEHEIRDLNDEINRKMREKWHWNRRIRELGGLDFNAIEKQRQIEEGDTQQHQGYRYFGAAKDLPGVKELLAKEEEKLQKKSLQHGDAHKNLTPDYYGWRDEEDGVLLELETLATKQMDQVYKKRRINQNDDTESKNDDYLAVPTQQDMAQILLEQKKRAMLLQFGL